MTISRRILGLNSLVRRKPLVINSLVYGSLYTGAEFFQQTYSRKFHSGQPRAALAIDTEMGARGPFLEWVQKLSRTLGLNQDVAMPVGDYNWPQLKRYATYGCFLAGPILHGWYHWLDSVYRGQTKMIVLKKLIADQFLLTPPLVALFFISMSLMEGKKDIFHECRVKFLTTFQTSCLYWIPIQLLNFMLVPPALRVFYVSVAAFCWVNILCYLKGQPSPKQQKNEKWPSL